MPQPETHKAAGDLLQALLTTHLLLYTERDTETRDRLESRHAQQFDRLAGLIAEALEIEFF